MMRGDIVAVVVEVVKRGSGVARKIEHALHKATSAVDEIKSTVKTVREKFEGAQEGMTAVAATALEDIQTIKDEMGTAMKMLSSLDCSLQHLPAAVVEEFKADLNDTMRMMVREELGRAFQGAAFEIMPFDKAAFEDELKKRKSQEEAAKKNVEAAAA